MAVEASDVAVDLVVAVDPVPADEALVAVDPIEYPIDLAPIGIAEPHPEVLPVDEITYVPDDAQTFGGPVDEILVDESMADGGSYEGIDRPVDPMPEWRTVDAEGGQGGFDPDVTDKVAISLESEVPPAGDGPDVPTTDEPKVVVDDNLMVLDGGSSIDFQPEDGATDASTDGGTDDGSVFTTMIVDEPPVDETLIDGSSGDDGSDTPVEGGGDGDIFITYVGEEYSGEETPGEEAIGRPVDPQPEWRTIDGDGSGEGFVGEGGGGNDGLIVIDKEILLDDAGFVDGETGSDSDDEGAGDPAPDDGSEIPDDVIYTLDPNDPLIYANTASGEVPGRSIDPLPYERTNSAPAVDPAAPDTASDVVHYAAAEPFHTGLDLL